MKRFKKFLDSILTLGDRNPILEISHPKTTFDKTLGVYKLETRLTSISTLDPPVEGSYVRSIEDLKMYKVTGVTQQPSPSR